NLRQHAGKNFELSGRGGEAGIPVFLVGSLKRHSDAARVRPQCIQAEAARRKMMVECRHDIAIPEVVSKAQADRKIEHHVDIGSSFAARCDDRRAKLYQLAGVLIEPEADPQSFALPGAGNGKYNVREGSGRSEIKIALHME